MGNTNIFLKKDNLLAFLVEPKEGFIDHYVSSQPLNLYIPYTEYVSLIKEMVSVRLDILRVPLNTYKMALSKGEDSVELLRLFQLDVANSALREVCKSHDMGFPCTRIYGLVDCDVQVGVENLSFTDAPKFIENHFTGDELMKIHKEVQENFYMPSVVTKSGTDNFNMYFTCLAFYGTWFLKKDFIVSMNKEE